jgi:uncharacterized protein
MQLNEHGKRVTEWGQLGIIIAFLGVGLIITALATLTIFGSGVAGDKDFNKVLMLPANVNKARILQTISSFALFLLPAICVAFISYQRGIAWLGFTKKFTAKQVLLVLAIMLVALFLGGGLAELNRIIPIPNGWRLKFDKMETDYNDMVASMSTMKGIGDYLISLCIFAVTAALTEEVFFRGALQKIFSHWWKMPMLSIILTGLLFSAVHFSFYGFLTRAMLGIVLGLIYHYSGSIWLSILGHFFNNAIAVTAMFVLSNNTSISADTKTKALEGSMPLWVLAFGLLLIPLFKAFRQASPTKNLVDENDGFIA